MAQSSGARIIDLTGILKNHFTGYSFALGW
jgi:hypothetical protein